MSRTTNADLDARINTFLNNSGISPRRLIYNWKEESETDAVFRFQRYHACISEALQNDSHSQLKCCIESILAWGNISVAKETRERYSAILFGLNAFGRSRFTITVGEQELTIDPSCPICYEFIKTTSGKLNRPKNNPPTRLSAWTKILAAYDPTRFCIYDSRVAIALRFLFRGDKWFIPDQYNNNNHTIPLAATIGRGTEPEESYRDYLTLLQNACPGNPGTYEKKLFMLGGVLTDMYANNPNLWIQASGW